MLFCFLDYLSTPFSPFSKHFPFPFDVKFCNYPLSLKAPLCYMYLLDCRWCDFLRTLIEVLLGYIMKCHDLVTGLQHLSGELPIKVYRGVTNCIFPINHFNLFQHHVSSNELIKWQWMKRLSPWNYNIERRWVRSLAKFSTGMFLLAWNSDKRLKFRLWACTHHSSLHVNMHAFTYRYI